MKGIDPKGYLTISFYMITHNFAKNSKGQRVDIGELNHHNKDQKYTCIGCEKVMIPCLGEVKQHYFRHKIVGECSGETYLHRLGKMTFKEVYEDCLKNEVPYNFQFETLKICERDGEDLGWTCSSHKEVVRDDLTKQFLRLELEKRDGEFIPDIQLIGEYDEIIYIEIAVTHKSEEEKQISGKKIIEFLIESESDIKHIESKLIKWKADWINTYGINPKPIKGGLCGRCKINKIKELKLQKRGGDQLCLDLDDFPHRPFLP